LSNKFWLCKLSELGVLSLIFLLGRGAIYEEAKDSLTFRFFEYDFGLKT